jgi:hypothetical protein
MHRRIGRVKYDLRQTFSIAQIDKNKLAVISANIHPALQSRGLASVGDG